MPQMKVMG